MSKRLIAWVIALSLLLSLAACGKSGETQTLTRGREFENWQQHYALPYIITFYMNPRGNFDADTHRAHLDKPLDSSFYYFAYHTLLATGTQLDAIDGERENWEGDLEPYLEYHAVPADLMESTMVKYLGLTGSLDHAAAPYGLYDASANRYLFYPPGEYDAASSALVYTGSAALKEVHIDRSVSPAVATLTIEESYEGGTPSLINRVTYREVDDTWQLDTAESYYAENSFVSVSSGLQLATLGGLAAEEAEARFQYGVATQSGILLLLANWEVEGYDLILIDRSGSVIATGQIPDAMGDLAAPTIYTIGSDLYIAIDYAAYVGDLSLSRFTRYEMSYSPAGGEPYSTVICPDLTTWYYTGRDGIYQYNADRDEHLAFATHPSPPLEEDHGLSGQVYRTLSLAQDGNLLVATVVGYEWMSDILTFDLTPGTPVTSANLDIGWGYSGSGHSGNDYFAYHDASTYNVTDQTYNFHSGWYAYRTGRRYAIDPAQIAAIGGSESYAIRTNVSGDQFAFVTMEGTPGGGNYTVVKATLSGTGDIELEAAVTLQNAPPTILGMFDSGEVLVCYNAFGHQGFVIA